MTTADRRLQMLRRMALGCVGLMLLTICLSAFIRLAQSGLGCADWPACYGQGLRILQQRMGDLEPGSHAVAGARLAHRIVASLALIVVIAMVASTLAARPVLRREGAIAAALLALALALAVLGIATPGARVPAVAMGNLLGGFAMLALCWRLAARGPASDIGNPSGLGAWGVAGLALVVLQVTLGALVSTSFAALSCTDLADCSRAAMAADFDWPALNPWREPAFDAMQPVRRSGAGALWLHRLGAIVVLPVVALLGLVAWRRGRRRAGAVLLVLAVMQGAIGPLIAAAGLPLAGVLLHNLVAALLLAALVRLV